MAKKKQKQKPKRRDHQNKIQYKKETKKMREHKEDTSRQKRPEKT
jgi:hypothetical protein